MTARDEAIDAALSAGLPNRQGIAAVIDAIPPGVLARLAIEQGALVETNVQTNLPSIGPLYRVVEP